MQVCAAKLWRFYDRCKGVIDRDQRSNENADRSDPADASTPVVLADSFDQLEA